MMFQRSFARIRLLIALCLAVSMGCVPSFQAFAHDQVLFATAAAERHLGLGDPVLADHSYRHTHDDGEPDKQRTGHTHEHNPADHTHDAGQAAVIPTDLFPIPRTSQQRGRSEDREKILRNRLDRPPRSLT